MAERVGKIRVTHHTTSRPNAPTAAPRGQNASTVWSIGTQPVMPAVYGVNAPLYGARSIWNSSALSQMRSVGRKYHFTPPPYSCELPNWPRTHDARPYTIAVFGVTNCPTVISAPWSIVDE